MVQFRQDRMTEKERLEALLNRQPVDRVIFDNMSYTFAAAMLGYSKVDMYTDPEKAFWAKLRLRTSG